jgi:hypothetical protein
MGCMPQLWDSDSITHRSTGLITCVSLCFHHVLMGNGRIIWIAWIIPGGRPTTGALALLIFLLIQALRCMLRSAPAVGVHVDT